MPEPSLTGNARVLEAFFFFPFSLTFPSFNQCFLNEKFLRIVALGMTSNRVIRLTPSYGMAALYCTASPVPLSVVQKESPRLFVCYNRTEADCPGLEQSLPWSRLPSVRSQGHIVLGRERRYIYSFLYTETISRLDAHHLLKTQSVLKLPHGRLVHFGWM